MKIPTINSRLKSYFSNGFFLFIILFILEGTSSMQGGIFLLPIFFNLRILNNFKIEKRYYFICFGLITFLITSLASFQIYYIDSIQKVFGCLRFGSNQFSLGNNAFVLLVLSAVLWEILIYFREKKFFAL